MLRWCLVVSPGHVNSSLSYALYCWKFRIKEEFWQQTFMSLIWITFRHSWLSYGTHKCFVGPKVHELEQTWVLVRVCTSQMWPRSHKLHLDIAHGNCCEGLVWPDSPKKRNWAMTGRFVAEFRQPDSHGVSAVSQSHIQGKKKQQN